MNVTTPFDAALAVARLTAALTSGSAVPRSWQAKHRQARNRVEILEADRNRWIRQHPASDPKET